MFVAYVNQTDNGCDYTIACGKVLWMLEAATREEALAELRGKVLGTFYPDEGYWEEGWHGDSKLASVILFDVSRLETVPLSLWYAQAEQMVEAVRERERELSERALYQQLKERLGAE